MGASVSQLGVEAQMTPLYTDLVLAHFHPSNQRQVEHTRALAFYTFSIEKKMWVQMLNDWHLFANVRHCIEAFMYAKALALLVFLRIRASGISYKLAFAYRKCLLFKTRQDKTFSAHAITRLEIMCCWD